MLRKRFDLDHRCRGHAHGQWRTTDLPRGQNRCRPDRASIHARE